MINQKLTYEELIQFVIDHFDSYIEFNSVLTKYNGNIRLTSLPEIDLVFYYNRPTLNTIAGEINSGKLQIFGEKMDINDLKFWISKNYPTKDKLEALIDLYTAGDHLEDIHQDLIVKNNFDEILNIYQELYDEDTENVETQIEETQSVTEDVADINLERYEKGFSVELFNEDELIMRKYKTFSDIPTQTEYLDVLQASLQQSAFNFKERHWSITGPGFKGVHELLGELYDKFDEYIDELVEARLANHDVFDVCITSFVFNSVIPKVDMTLCPLKETYDTLSILIELGTANQDKIYDDLIGRLVTDMIHYKFMFNGYLEAQDHGTLSDETIIVDPNYEPEPESVNEGIEEIPIDNQLAIIKSYCKTKRQAKCFNQLVKVFSLPTSIKDCIDKSKLEFDEIVDLYELSKNEEDKGHFELKINGKEIELMPGPDMYLMIAILLDKDGQYDLDSKSNAKLLSARDFDKQLAQFVK